LKGHDLVRAIDAAIESGRIVLKDGRGGGADRRASFVANAILGGAADLPFEGQRYRLADTSVSTPGALRNTYRAVGMVEAPDLVQRMALAIPKTTEARALWAEAVSMVVEPREGRGLRLLRYAPSGGASPRPDGPAVTPSQLAPKVPDTHWVEVRSRSSSTTAHRTTAHATSSSPAGA
jgi:hypothetical protein